MSITITGGISFTGGVGIIAPPPSTATAGWFGGGNPGTTSTVQRITFATDTATATIRGPLSTTFINGGATGTLTYGWFAGGPAPTTSVSRITYSTDTATASARGPLEATRYLCAATGSDSYGYFAGGQLAPGPYQTNMSRVTYSNDTVTATATGTFSQGFNAASATTDTTTYGWFGGGRIPGFVAISTVNRITYATDSGSASTRGPLSSARYFMGATGNSTYGYFGAAYSNITSVDRITYATDTATATKVTNMAFTDTNSIFKYSAVGNSSYGWFGGGRAFGPSAAITTIQRIDYANDTAALSTRGPLSAAAYSTAASSGVQ